MSHLLLIPKTNNLPVVLERLIPLIDKHFFGLETVYFHYLNVLFIGHVSFVCNKNTGPLHDESHFSRVHSSAQHVHRVDACRYIAPFICSIFGCQVANA